MEPATCFLNIPLEIRRMIYSVLLVADGPITPQYRDFQTSIFYDRYLKPNLSVQLLLTNRQIGEEASAVLYGGNDFELTDYLGPFRTPGHIGQPATPINWLALIGPFNLSCIRNLSVDWAKPLNPLWDDADHNMLLDIMASYEKASQEGYDVISKGIMEICSEAQTNYVKGIEECLKFIGDMCTEFQYLEIVLPNADACELGGDGWNGEDWEPSFFKNPVFVENHKIRELLAAIKGVRKLHLGHTTHVQFAHDLAEKMGVDEMVMKYTMREAIDVDHMSIVEYLENGWIMGEDWNEEFELVTLRKVFRT